MIYKAIRTAFPNPQSTQYEFTFSALPRQLVGSWENNILAAVCTEYHGAPNDVDQGSPLALEAIAYGLSIGETLKSAVRHLTNSHLPKGVERMKSVSSD